MTDNFEKVVRISFLVIAAFLAADIWSDLRHGSDWEHVLFEAGAFLVCFGVLATQSFSYIRLRNVEAVNASVKVRDLTAERDQWRARSEQYLLGLSSAIDDQFTRWNLSPSERDVALLILKGLSHKEIAAARATSERTVRQQAAAVYGKAGLENKAQLSAFFLDELNLPDSEPD